MREPSDFKSGHCPEMDYIALPSILTYHPTHYESSLPEPLQMLSGLCISSSDEPLSLV
jgi:hypothetical protein